MRIVLLAAASLAAFACSKTSDTASTPASSTPAMADGAQSNAGAAAATPTPTAPSAMANMPAADAKPADAPLAETPDKFTFHVLPGTKEEKVVLPAKGGASWTPDKPSSEFYTLKDTSPAKLADGSDVQVFTFAMLKSGNAAVTFTKSGGAKDARTVNFMIH